MNNVGLSNQSISFGSGLGTRVLNTASKRYNTALGELQGSMTKTPGKPLRSITEAFRNIGRVFRATFWTNVEDIASGFKR